MEDIEQIIREVDGSMRMEGMPLTDEDKENIRICLEDNSKLGYVLESIKKQYSPALGVKYMDYVYEYETGGGYCYPKTNVLKNKLGIKNAEELSEAERKITSVCIGYIKQNPVAGKFDFTHLKAIHKAIFSEIYDWAGKPRTVNIAKGNLFCNTQHLDEYATGVFSKLKGERFLIECDEKNIAPQLAYYLSEINVMHPFREGNGRTQRVFIEYLAHIAGYHLDFSNVSDDDMVTASANAFALDYELLNRIIGDNITHISCEQQIKYAEMITGKRSEIFKIIKNHLG